MILYLMRTKLLLIIIMALGLLISTQTIRAEGESECDYPENCVSVMKYWINPEDLKIAIEELERLLNMLLPEEAIRLDEYWKEIQQQNYYPYHCCFIQQIYRGKVCNVLKKLKKIYEIYDHLSHEEFGLMLADISDVSNFFATMGVVKISDKIDFRGTTGYINVFSNTRCSYKNDKGEDKYIAGYLGPDIANSLKQFLTDIYTRFPPRYLPYFILDMLRAEAYYRLNAYEEAEKIYKDKIDNKGGYNLHPDTFEPLSYLKDEELKMIKIRAAFNYLAWGNRYFKQAHVSSGQEKQADLDSAKVKYEKALEFFLDTNIARQVDSMIRKLNQLDKQLIEDINKPTLSAEIPVGLLEPIVIPMKPYEIAKPSTINLPLMSPTSIKSTEKPQPLESQTSETIVPVTIRLAYPMPYVPQENPLIIQIVCHANMQLLKIQKKLNYLGYTDGYIPDQRYFTLYNHANEYVDLAIQAENRHIQFKKEAEDQEYQILQLDQNVQIAGVQKQIAQTHHDIATDRMKQADEKMKAIDEKIKSIIASKRYGFFSAMVSAFAGFVAGAALGPGGAIAGWLGAGATMIGEMGRQISTDHEIAALQHEKRAVAIEKCIACREGFIARLEETIAIMQQTFMKQNINFLSAKTMNQELFYALAKTLRQIKDKYLEIGIRMGYLAERALAFEMGKELQFIKFDYEVSTLKGLLAGDFLKQDLEMMEYDRTLSLPQRNHVKHIISLRQHYPIEFTNFIQTGTMTFATGLYDFDKAYPGTYQRRLKRVEVAINGVVGPEGFKGSLTNFGSFVVRNKELTMASRRLIPTEKQIQDAYKKLKADSLLVLPVGGLNAFSLPSTRLVLSKYDIRQDQIIFPPETEVREPFEGFGVAGLWRLELPKNMNDADYRTIADIKLILYFNALYDPAVENKLGGYYNNDERKWVKGLVQKYEEEVSGGKKLDQIAAFSLRQHFPDEFFSLTNGEVEFELLDGDFPLYMTNKKVKKVMVLAVDQKGKGVAGIKLSISKIPSALSIDAVTKDNGYAIDDKGYMNPAEETLLPDNLRAPVVGFWDIKLTDQSQASTIDDLFVFFMYEYNEKTGRWIYSGPVMEPSPN